MTGFAGKRRKIASLPVRMTNVVSASPLNTPGSHCPESSTLPTRERTSSRGAWRRGLPRGGRHGLEQRVAEGLLGFADNHFMQKNLVRATSWSERWGSGGG